ncbi:MAG: PQQ-binding-like beta-propeller repeat protein [Chitinispirillaceae bacterium]|nr:PQQ-binding-like beta-propeller repeat protein [Chitinispirillaceae bacterium]
MPTPEPSHHRCDDFMRIEAYLHGDMSEIECRQMERHIGSCARCAKTASDIGSLYARIRESSGAETTACTLSNERMLQQITGEIVSGRYKTSIAKSRRNHRAIMVVIPVAAVIGITAFLFQKRHNEAAGTMLWEREGIRSFKTGTHYAPIAGDTVIFAVTAQPGTDGGKVLALHGKTGKTVWESETESTGRLLADGNLVVTVGNTFGAPYLAAIDRATGATRWRYDLPHPVPDHAIAVPVAADNYLLWSTGSLLTIINRENGYPERILSSEAGGLRSRPVSSGNRVIDISDNRLTCRDLESGSLLWERMVDKNLSPFFRPQLSAGRTIVFVAGKTGYGRSFGAGYRLEDGNELWKKDDLSAHHLYAVGNCALFRGGVTVCVDSTGSVVWEQVTPGCSPVTIAGNHAWYFDASEGGGLYRVGLSSGRRDRHYTVENSCTGVLVLGELLVMCTNNGIIRAYKSSRLHYDIVTMEKE